MPRKVETCFRHGHLLVMINVVSSCMLVGTLLTDAEKASWRSGYAADCKSVNPGSIPGEASITALW